jgi:transcriptional regulator with XRE-family HTH domain
MKLKAFRKSKGASQESLARKMDISLSYYSQVENGHVNAEREFMRRLKAVYPDISIDEMFFSDVTEAVV